MCVVFRYHKVALKSKRRAAMLQFEELCNTDPQRAAEELQKMERERIREIERRQRGMLHGARESGGGVRACVLTLCVASVC